MMESVGMSKEEAMSHVGVSGTSKALFTLPTKEVKISEFKITGHHKDLLFPEYGIHLKNKNPDMSDYANEFSRLTIPEKEAIRKWTLPPHQNEIPDSIKLNMYLRSGIKLTDELKTFDVNLSSALGKGLPKKKLGENSTYACTGFSGGLPSVF